jgi:hypothetical protein
MNVSINIVDGPDQAADASVGTSATNSASMSAAHDDAHANDAGAPPADLVREIEAALALATSQSALADNALDASDAGAAPS